MTRQTKGSEGYAFRIGNTHIYAGPDDPIGPRPILAVARQGEKMKRLGEFRNSASAEAFIDALKTGIDEGTAIRITPAAAPTEGEQP